MRDTVRGGGARHDERETTHRELRVRQVLVERRVHVVLDDHRDAAVEHRHIEPYAPASARGRQAEE